jgi:hypothetical protein
MVGGGECVECEELQMLAVVCSNLSLIVRKKDLIGLFLSPIVLLYAWQQCVTIQCANHVAVATNYCSVKVERQVVPEDKWLPSLSSTTVARMQRLSLTSF